LKVIPLEVVTDRAPTCPRVLDEPLPAVASRRPVWNNWIEADYVYRPADRHGQIIDLLLSAPRTANAARRFFGRALNALMVTPFEVVTDNAPAYLRVIDQLVAPPWQHIAQHEINRIEADHSRLKHRLRLCAGFAPRVVRDSPVGSRPCMMCG